MTCNSCKKKFSQGYTTHSSSFFCESCAKKNHANGEFKVWVEAVKKNNRNPNQESKSNPPANRESNPPQNNPQQKKCTSCQKIQGREDFYLATEEDTGKQLGYYCK